MKKWANIEGKIIPALFLACLVFLWQGIVDGGLVEKYILPSPRDILHSLGQIFPEVQRHLFITLKEAFLGFAISILLAMVLAVVMDSLEIVKKALYPLLIVSQTVPIIALAPLFVIWFGFGELPKIIVVVLVCFFPIVVSVLDGLASADPDIINLLHLMGANRLQIFRLIKLPASLVNFFSGLRIAATYSIMGAVIGEWLGGVNGLGVYMLRVKHSYALDKMFAVILVVVVLSMVLFQSLFILQRVLMPWQSQTEKK